MNLGTNMSLGLRKGAWTMEEDILLKDCIEKHGEGKWHLIPLRAGLNRCRKSCRLRWLNYLRPNIKRGEFAEDEVDLILRLHKLLGNRWSLIAGRIPGRTANDVKNYWYTHILSRSKQQKKELDDGESSQHASTITIKPKPWTFSKPLNMAHGSSSINSQNDGADNNFNVSTNVLDDNIKGYLDDLFDDRELMETDGNFGWSSFGGTIAEGEALNVVEQEDEHEISLFDFPMDEATRDHINSDLL